MSAVAIVSVAALCAGYVWVERRRVRRAAVARGQARRARGVLQWTDGGVGSDDGSSRRLQSSLERAIVAADVAWTYHQRLFEHGPSGESPFQIRRTRVNGAYRRLTAAMERVGLAAAHWLEHPREHDACDAQNSMAVRRVSAWLREHPLPPSWPFGRSESLRLDATVDVLENALANLRQRRLGGDAADPFRRAASLRQDVSARRQ